MAEPSVRPVTIREGLVAGGDRPLFIAGPCVIESESHVLSLASSLAKWSGEFDLSLVFKASFDKANRTSISSYRGPGLKEGLRILARAKAETGLAITTDIHEPSQAESIAAVADVIQVPAFLCRQTDLLKAAAATGRVVNVKKGQFLSPYDAAHVVEKLDREGAAGILLTERGATFGYNNLVVDMRSIPIMRSLGVPVVFDATHSVQLPGGAGGSSSGQREFIAPLARAAAGAGADAFFFEVHDNPGEALSDGPNALPLEEFPALVRSLEALYGVARRNP